MERLGLRPDSKVLDIGCGCAGLGLALKERFGVMRYTGVEINEKAAKTAETLYPEAEIICRDILSISQGVLQKEDFDFVFSLSCVDWNLEFADMMKAAFSFVRRGGYFVSSFRLTAQDSIIDIARSYQYVDFEGQKTGEIAPYVVLNLKELIKILKGFSPSEIQGYGYWGQPRDTAVTPYKNVCFAVIAVQKSLAAMATEPVIHLEIPQDLLVTLMVPSILGRSK